MPTSPREYLKRKRVWTHVPPTSDRYHQGALHSHDRDLDDTQVGEMLQEEWPEIDPDQKGLEDGTIPV